jgi:hypothetical protein
MTPYWPAGEPIQVVTGPETPQRFAWRGREHTVAEVGTTWRIHIAWWRDQEIWRDYWEVTTTTRLLCLIFHDLHTDRWGLERVWE